MKNEEVGVSSLSFTNGNTISNEFHIPTYVKWECMQVLISFTNVEKCKPVFAYDPSPINKCQTEKKKDGKWNKIVSI